MLIPFQWFVRVSEPQRGFGLPYVWKYFDSYLLSFVMPVVLVAGARLSLMMDLPTPPAGAVSVSTGICPSGMLW